MKTDKTYNGWTNYATWRVHLEIFDGLELDKTMSADELEELAEDILFRPFSNSNRQLVEGYARAFLSDVNWYEIAKHLNERLAV